MSRSNSFSVDRVLPVFEELLITQQQLGSHGVGAGGVVGNASGAAHVNNVYDGGEQPRAPYSLGKHAHFTPSPPMPAGAAHRSGFFASLVDVDMCSQQPNLDSFSRDLAVSGSLGRVTPTMPTRLCPKSLAALQKELLCVVGGPRAVAEKILDHKKEAVAKWMLEREYNSVVSWEKFPAFTSSDILSVNSDEEREAALHRSVSQRTHQQQQQQATSPPPSGGVYYLVDGTHRGAVADKPGSSPIPARDVASMSSSDDEANNNNNNSDLEAEKRRRGTMPPPPEPMEMVRRFAQATGHMMRGGGDLHQSLLPATKPTVARGNNNNNNSGGCWFSSPRMAMMARVHQEQQLPTTVATSSSSPSREKRSSNRNSVHFVGFEEPQQREGEGAIIGNGVGGDDHEWKVKRLLCLLHRYVPTVDEVLDKTEE